jgi:hypothetical protein
MAIGVSSLMKITFEADLIKDCTASSAWVVNTRLIAASFERCGTDSVGLFKTKRSGHFPCYEVSTWRRKELQKLRF